MVYVWDKSMTTGVPRIDAQHQELIQKLNGLLAAMKVRKGQEELVNLIGFLGEYVTKHFSDEEAEMERRKCPLAVTNKLAHQQFLRKFQSFKKRFETEGSTPSLILEVQKELGDWVVQHIKQVDTKLAVVVNEPVAT
ncbi:MAG: bacteriohemerythrin [Anaerolineae bacterium]